VPEDAVSEIKALEELNIRIGKEESRRDPESYQWFTNMIAPALAFQRANEQLTTVTREQFLESVEPLELGEDPPPGRETEVESISFYRNRAVVTCIVTMDDGRRFHNLRLLVRRDNEWKLLGWANEQI